MMLSFLVRTTAGYERLARRLLKGNPEFALLQERAVSILAHDPYNHTKTHHIKRLEGVRPGEGQWRLSLGRWRFRYDIRGQDIVLQYCGLRREETYRH